MSLASYNHGYSFAKRTYFSFYWFSASFCQFIITVTFSVSKSKPVLFNHQTELIICALFPCFGFGLKAKKRKTLTRSTEGGYREKLTSRGIPLPTCEILRGA